MSFSESRLIARIALGRSLEYSQLVTSCCNLGPGSLSNRLVVLGERVKLLRPKLAVAGNPLVQLTKLLGTKHADSLVRARACFDEAATSQDPKIPRYGRLRQAVNAGGMRTGNQRSAMRVKVGARHCNTQVGLMVGRIIHYWATETALSSFQPLR